MQGADIYKQEDRSLALTWSWKVLHLRISLDYEGPAGMERRWARGHSKRDDVANKGDRRRSHTTRTCTDEVRGHQQKRRSETTAVREALRHRPGQYEVLVPRQRTCSICTSIACRKKQPAGPTAKQSNSKLDGCTAAFLDFEQQKNAPWLPQKGPACGSRRRGRRGG